MTGFISTDGLDHLDAARSRFQTSTDRSCHHVIFFRHRFLHLHARSIAALEQDSMLRMISYPHRPPSGHFMC